MSDLSKSPISQELIDALLETLDQGEVMLHVLDDDQYSKHLPSAMNASIGGHYRHCLEHFISLIRSLEAEDLNYDARDRDSSLENDRFAALNMTRQMKRDFSDRLSGLLDRRIKVINRVNYSVKAPQVVESTLGREIMYVVAHAVHHYALIRLMGGLLEIALPKDFGVAPSTVAFRSGR